VNEVSRRAFLVSGGALAAAWLVAPTDKIAEAGRWAARAAREDPPLKFLVLTADEAADLDAATAQIIPSDDTPGAHEARVVYFIDKSLTTWAKDQLPGIRDGIAELRKRARQTSVAGGSVQAGSRRSAFAALNADQQHEILASMEKDKHPFFNTLRFAAVTGMLVNPEYGGNYNKIGWKMIGFDDRFSWGPPYGWYDAQ